MVDVHSRRMPELRLAILDSDSGFVRVLVKRAGDLGWQYRCLEAPPRTEEFVAMRVNALVVDLALPGQGAWDFLEEVSATLFEPTITFKKHGMGLGLSIAKKNALLSGGDVIVIHGELGGAAFRVSLPS